MDKDSIILLQELDCNCNDCLFMARSAKRFKASLQDHHRWQLDYFNAVRDNLYRKAEQWKLRGFSDKYQSVKKEADKLRFQFDKKEALINYGRCSESGKAVSFIPNILQLDTQHCFKHRRVPP